MELSGKGGHRGSGSRKLGASSYLLELFPDSPSNESVRRQIHPESFSSHHLTGARVDESSSRQRESISSSTHSLYWGRDQGQEDLPRERFPSPTKLRLSRSKQQRSHHNIPTTPLDMNATSTITTTYSKDHLIFTESPLNPGVPVVCRMPEERSARPDRLNLDRQHFSVCPILEGEDQLRLLNLQHNSISAHLQHLHSLRHLVFLDLYDNLVHDVAGLGGLVSLRVLMLGRNRIRTVAGIESLSKLDVLDLHGNMIQEVECLNHLTRLRVLNLAGNDISCVSGLTNLRVLNELNLRRNRITNVYGLDELISLQRLFLSHNRIQSFDDAPCLSQCNSLKELTLDGNPLANAPDHRRAVIYRINQLHLLNQTLVTEEEQQEALAAAHAEQEKTKEEKKLIELREIKQATIAAIRSRWEKSHRQNHFCSSGSLESASCTERELALRRHSDDKDPLSSLSLPPHLMGLSSASCYVDYSEDILHLYGQGACDAVEASGLHHRKPPTVEVCFHYMEFEEVAKWLPKMGRLLPNVTSLVFESTNMSGLEQVNALARLISPLHSLRILTNGNPITLHPLFLTYTLYRLAHLGLSVLNGTPVRDKDLVEAEQMFGRLSQLTTSHLPQGRLLALISRYRPQKPRRTFSATTKSGTAANTTCSEPVSRVGLHKFSPKHKPLDVAQQERVNTARTFCSSLLTSTLEKHNKQVTLDLLWPKVLARLVSDAIGEYSDMDQNMKTTLETL